jgi:hypothetical protein
MSSFFTTVRKSLRLQLPEGASPRRPEPLQITEL